MPAYANAGGDSGITEFEIGPDSITVTFRDGSIYLYTYRSNGQGNIEEMKRLAMRGEGLNAFITTRLNRVYDRRIR